MRPCFVFAKQGHDKKTVSYWTIRVWRERVPKNGTLPMIGQYRERNAVQMSAAASFGWSVA